MMRQLFEFFKKDSLYPKYKIKHLDHKSDPYQEYQFKYLKDVYYEHYIKTDQKLNDEELKLLGQMLASFPHSCDNNWPNTFAEFKENGFSQKLLLLAANAYDGSGNTVLGVAAENGQHLKAIQRLIDMGADVNQPDDNKKIPLYWAIGNKLSWKEKQSIGVAKSLKTAEVVQCLLDNGARTDIICYEKSNDVPGSKDLTPFQYAKSRGYEAAASLLSEKALLLRHGLFNSREPSDSSFLKTGKESREDAIFNNNIELSLF